MVLETIMSILFFGAVSLAVYRTILWVQNRANLRVYAEN